MLDVGNLAKSCACKHGSKDHLRTIWKQSPAPVRVEETQPVRSAAQAWIASLTCGSKLSQVHSAMLMLSGQERDARGQVAKQAKTSSRKASYGEVQPARTRLKYNRP
jgi:hypothetical protein